jgi:hypothetical protein
MSSHIDITFNQQEENFHVCYMRLTVKLSVNIRKRVDDKGSVYIIMYVSKPLITSGSMQIAKPLLTSRSM